MVSQLLDAEELFALSELDVVSRNLEAALLKLKQCLELNDPIIVKKAHGSLARIYAQLKLYQKSLKHFDIMLSESPDALLEQFQMGLVLYQMRQFEDALERWKEVERLSINYPPFLFYSALAKLNLGEKSVALHDLQEIKKKVPSDNLYAKRADQVISNLLASNKASSSQESQDLLEIPDDIYKAKH